jgi:hypothetical protein
MLSLAQWTRPCGLPLHPCSGKTKEEATIFIKKSHIEMKQANCLIVRVSAIKRLT